MCGCLMCPLLGTWPATQACALTGNQLVTLWFVGQSSLSGVPNQEVGLSPLWSEDVLS